MMLVILVVPGIAWYDDGTTAVVFLLQSLQLPCPTPPSVRKSKTSLVATCLMYLEALHNCEVDPAP